MQGQSFVKQKKLLKSLSPQRIVVPNGLFMAIKEVSIISTDSSGEIQNEFWNMERAGALKTLTAFISLVNAMIFYQAGSVHFRVQELMMGQKFNLTTKTVSMQQLRI